MNHKTTSGSIIMLLSLLYCTSLYAAGDMTARQAISVKVELGNKQNQLRFYPSSLQFETGKLYKLIISNPSKQKHYFTADGLAAAVFTRKVEVVNSKGATVAEVKGSVREIEVYPGGTAEWWFVPVKTLKASPLHCSIKGHIEAGMTGSITIN